MALWHTWLGYIGLICGILASAVLGTSILRSAAIGFATGVVMVVIINVATPGPTPCLQDSKGWDILRAYSLDCRK
jgi:hypothetical protein